MLAFGAKVVAAIAQPGSFAMGLVERLSVGALAKMLTLLAESVLGTMLVFVARGRYDGSDELVAGEPGLDAFLEDRPKSPLANRRFGRGFRLIDAGNRN